MTPHDRLLERLRAHCLSKPGTTEELPFDERTVVFKVGGRFSVFSTPSNFKDVDEVRP